MGLLDRLFGRAKPPAKEPLLVNAYATVRDLPPLDFPHHLNGCRDLTDPELPGHLNGFAGFVMRHFDGRMTAKRYHLLQHIQRVRSNASFDVAADAMPAMSDWARRANAILFLPDGSVCAPDMTTILWPGGDTDDEAELPYPADAFARRTRTLQALAGILPAPPASMPPSLGEAELVTRTARDVWHRALALNAVATAAAAFNRGETPARPAILALTPKERAFLDAPDADTAVAMSWRFEALHVLLWALGLIDLSPAVRTIEPEVLARCLAQAAQSDPDGVGLRLRPAADILDALDLTWRQHWITRQAAMSKVDLTALHPDIVQERHLALNWLTGFQNPPDTGWDDTDTPT